jgi:hypothetical protein
MFMYLLHVLQLSKIACQRDYLRHAQFRDTILQYDSTQLVSIDEAAVDSRNMNRVGIRLRVSVPCLGTIKMTSQTEGQSMNKT